MSIEIDEGRLHAELKRMKKLIRDDPRVRARFDTDGNGVIDGDEWGAVRQLVVHRLEREAMEADIARQLHDQLDPEQAAELARLEADIAAEEEAERRQPGIDLNIHERSDETHQESVEGRDWDNVELAFDPHQPRRGQKGTVADDIYERELLGRQLGESPHVGGSSRGSIAEHRELVLEQGGGAKQFFGNTFRREYIIRDSHGEEIGRIGQRENEMLQNMTDYSILHDPELNFSVHDHLSGEDYTFSRNSGISDNSVTVMNSRGMMLARSSWTLSFIRRKYEIRAVREGVSYYVRRRMLNPWTFDVLDPFEEPIGTMQRGWSGLGFMTGGNLFHIEVGDGVSDDAMWGFLATALLADLDSESGSRRSGLDFFNE